MHTVIINNTSNSTFHQQYSHPCLLGCNVGGLGNPGNSTVQGTCPNKNQVCNPDGSCTGTFVSLPHTKGITDIINITLLLFIFLIIVGFYILACDAGYSRKFIKSCQYQCECATSDGSPKDLCDYCCKRENGQIGEIGILKLSL